MAAVIPGIMSAMQAAGPLASLLGGGGSTKVSTNSTNTTSLNVTNVLSNQSPGNQSGSASGAPSVSTSSAASGSDKPPTQSLFPIGTSGLSEGSGVPTEVATQAGSSGVLSSDIIRMLGIGGVLAAVAFFLLRKKRR